MEIKVISRVSAKTGKKYVVLCIGDKFVSFDSSLISYLTNLSLRELENLENDIVLGKIDI